MTISSRCRCGQSLDTDSANSGRVLQCPHCGRDWIVPEAPLPPGTLFIADDPATTPGRGGKPILGIVLVVIGCVFLFALIVPVSNCGNWSAARRAQCTNNLKHIGLAMYEYSNAHERLPAASITDKHGKPLLSWRVALLPYLEEGTLYEKFHLDEPWDSPHNLTLLDQMPGFYRCPSDESLKRGTTGYQVVVGRDTPFTPDDRGLLFRLPDKDSNFPDSRSFTLLVSESDHAVPWTKPEDVPFEIALHTSGLCGVHGTHNDGFNALMADGSVHFLKSNVDPMILHGLLTRNGNEVIAEDSF